MINLKFFCFFILFGGLSGLLKGCHKPEHGRIFPVIGPLALCVETLSTSVMMATVMFRSFKSVSFFASHDHSSFSGTALRSF